MKRSISITISIILVLTFSSCQSNTPPDNETIKDTTSETETITPVVEHPEEIANIVDFKCVCSTHKTKFVIEDEEAKALYTYIMEQWEKAEKTETDRTEQDYIYLSFQDGEPFLIHNQEPIVSENLGSIEEADEHFYGVFWIHENDYMVYTAMPMTSFQIYYKMPEGTYEKIAEMIAE